MRLLSGTLIIFTVAVSIIAIEGWIEALVLGAFMYVVWLEYLIATRHAREPDTPIVDLREVTAAVAVLRDRYVSVSTFNSELTDIASLAIQTLQEYDEETGATLAREYDNAYARFTEHALLPEDE